MKKSAEETLKEIQDLSVDEYATPCTVTASKTTKLDELMEMMESNGIRHIPILDGTQTLGMVSDRDIANVPEGTNILAADAMSEDIYTVEAGTLLRDVVFEMSTKKIGSAIVHDASDNSISIFTSVDALNALNEILRGDISSF